VEACQTLTARCAIQLNPYLPFAGRCEAAFKFYEKCLAGKIVAVMTYKLSCSATELVLRAPQKQ